MVSTTHHEGASWFPVRRRLQDVYGKQTVSPWREEALAKTEELTSLLDWWEKDQRHDNPEAKALFAAARRHLEKVQASAHASRIRPSVLLASVNGAAIERTLANLDAAGAIALRLAPEAYLRAELPALSVQAARVLGTEDPRRKTLEENKKVVDTGGPVPADSIVAAYTSVHAEMRRGGLRSRGFRNAILLVALLAAVVAGLVGLFGALQDDWVPLCFTSTTAGPSGNIAAAVCPTGQMSLPSPDQLPNFDLITHAWDYAIVMALGALGGAISAATAMRNSRQSEDPYSLVAAAAFLKLPLGALSALLGLLLLRAGFVPGFTALDSPAQIIAWAIVLGYAQQLFTRFVDNKAQSVLGQTPPSALASL